MNAFKIVFISALLIVFTTSCSTIRVTTDYETQTDFTRFKTFAFYKSGIDKAPISDIDKRRIIRAISQELEAKGMVKSETPDVLVSIFTKANKQVTIHENPWRPFYYSPFHRTQITKHTEGTLFIDIIEKEKKKLIWQGIGKGALTQSSTPEKREAMIKKFVRKILEEYPPK